MFLVLVVNELINGDGPQSLNNPNYSYFISVGRIKIRDYLLLKCSIKVHSFKYHIPLLEVCLINVTRQQFSSFIRIHYRNFFSDVANLVLKSKRLIIKKLVNFYRLAAALSLIICK